jgi:hypothetical protein
MYSIQEIIDAPDDYDLVSLETLKVALGVTDVSEDAQLAAAITHWSKVIADDVSRVFARQTVTETFRIGRRDGALGLEAPLILSHAPVEAIDSVAVDGGAVTDYDLDPAMGAIWLHTTVYPQAVIVTYTAGYYLPDDAPAKLQQATIQAVRDNRSLQSSSSDQAVRVVSHGDLTVGYYDRAEDAGQAGSLSTGVKEMIAPFRRPVLE